MNDDPNDSGRFFYSLPFPSETADDASLRLSPFVPAPLRLPVAPEAGGRFAPCVIKNPSHAAFVRLSDDLSVGKDDPTIGHGGQMFIVSYDNDRLPQPVAQLEEQPMDLLARLGIEIAGGFVRQQHRR